MNKKDTTLIIEQQLLFDVNASRLYSKIIAIFFDCYHKVCLFLFYQFQRTHKNPFMVSNRLILLQFGEKGTSSNG